MAASTLAIFDLDGTITRHDTMWPFVSGYLLRHPARWWRLPLCLFPLLKHFLSDRDRGLLKGAVLRLTLGGVARADLDRWAFQYTRQLLRAGLYGEALERIATLRKAQARLVLLSASPDLYVPLISRALGFDECICTEVRWRADGRLDGSLSSANRRGAEKTRCVRELLAKYEPSLSQAYGNDPADLEHLALVSAGVYVNGRPQDVLKMPSIRVARWSTRGDGGTLAPQAGL